MPGVSSYRTIAPNRIEHLQLSSGRVASLHVIGTEFYPTTDLTAVISGLPASTFGFMAVARTPAPVGPFGVFRLSIGSGPISAFGRYPAFQTLSQGDAVVTLE